jgi:integrase
VGANAQRRRVETVKQLQALGPSDDGSKVLLGDGLTGVVRAGRDGAISVHVGWRYRFAGKVRELRIGTWRDKDGMSLKSLRDERDRLAAEVRGGIDPIERKAAERLQADAEAAEQQRRDRERIEAARDAELAAQRRLTVRQVFNQWQRVELKPQILADGTRIGRKDGGEWVKQSFERRVFPRLGSTPAEDVRRADLLAILDDTKAEGHRRTANVLFADLRQMFRFAAEREIVQRNPLEGIKRARVGGKDTKRERVLSDDEIHALWRAVPQARLSQRSALAVWLILSTAVRVGEAMGARWEHVNLQARTWYLPNTKNQRDHTIHLSDFALQQFEALAALRELDDDGQPVPWVFPATDRAKSVCIKSFGKQLADRQREPEARMSNRTKATHALALPGGKWTAHDLRRTAATLMARVRINKDVINECLNHKLDGISATYMPERRQEEQVLAFDAIGQRLAQLTSDEGASANVLPLRAA